MWITENMRLITAADYEEARRRFPSDDPNVLNTPKVEHFIDGVAWALSRTRRELYEYKP